MTPAEGTPPHGESRQDSGPSVAREQLRRRMRSGPVLEHEVERLAARVVELEREKADAEAFAASAAHELVEPLVMAGAYVAIVSDRLSGSDHADSLRDLAALGRGLTRLRLLAESLLHDARATEHKLEHKPVDMSALVSDCVALLQPEIASRDARVEQTDMPGALGDEALLSGVISNLLINALKYSPRQGAAIRVGGTREDTTCRFFVDSEGPTIPSRDRARIFRAYQRGRNERRATGAGLGLAICRRIVERHGGEIGVVPVKGGGNRFFFTLPD